MRQWNEWDCFETNGIKITCKLCGYSFRDQDTLRGFPDFIPLSFNKTDTMLRHLVMFHMPEVLPNVSPLKITETNDGL